MASKGSDSGIVKIEAEQFAEVAVHAIQRLDYHIVSASTTTFGRIIAKQDKREKIGRDWWNHEWRLELSYEPLEDDDENYEGILVEAIVREETNSGTNYDCEKRCDKLIRVIQEDAKRAQKVAKWTKPPKTHGAAKWASIEDLKKKDYLKDSVDPARTILTKLDNFYVSVPEKETYKHGLVCGRTGVGKSSGFFIPNLVERVGCNMLVTEALPQDDEPGELYSLTAGWRQKQGHKIYSFNPADLTSTRINPIDSVRNAPKSKVSTEAKGIAELIIGGEGDSHRVDKTWDKSEKQLLYPLILHAAASSKEEGNLGAVRTLLMKGVDNIGRELKQSDSAIALNEYQGWYNNTSENFRRGVASGLIAKLTPWQTDEIMELTSTTDIDLKVLEDDLFTFYLSVPVQDPDSKIVTALVFNYLVKQMLRAKRKMTRPLALFLDEFTNFGYIPGIENMLSLVRKMEVSLVLGFQSYAQVEQVYGYRKALTIVDQPGTQVYFRQKKFREAKELSDALGKTTVLEKKVADTGKVHEHIFGRNLMTPDELISLPEEEVIVFTPNTGPIKIDKLKPGIYSSETSHPAPKRKEHEISDFIKSRHEKKDKKAAKPNKEKVEKKEVAEKEQDLEVERNRPEVRKDKEVEKKSRKEKEREQETAPTGDDVWDL